MYYEDLHLSSHRDIPGVKLLHIAPQRRLAPMHSTHHLWPTRPRKVVIALLLEIEEVEPNAPGTLFEDLDAAKEAFEEEVFQTATVLWGRGVTMQDCTLERIS
jgi:hypothetical protein